MPAGPRHVLGSTAGLVWSTLLALLSILAWWRPPLGLEEWAGAQRTLARQAEAGGWQVTLPGAEKRGLEASQDPASGSRVHHGAVRHEGDTRAEGPVCVGLSVQGKCVLCNPVCSHVSLCGCGGAPRLHPEAFHVSLWPFLCGSVFYPLNCLSGGTHVCLDAAGGCVCATLHVSVHLGARVWTWHQCVYICMTGCAVCVCDLWPCGIVHRCVRLHTPCLLSLPLPTTSLC